MGLFKKNKTKEDIEERKRGQDEGYETEELEEWEKASAAFVQDDEEEYGEHEQGAERLEEMDMSGILKELSGKLEEFERIRDELRKQIESTSELLPMLNQEKERLGKYIGQKQQKIAEITNLIPELEEKKKSIQEDIRRRQEEKERLENYIQRKQGKIAEITELIPNLDENRNKIQEKMEREQKEMARIDEELRLVSFAQKYRARLIKL